MSQKTVRNVLFGGCLAALTIASIVDVSDAVAFPFESSWHLAASGTSTMNRAGAEGIYGLGSPSEFGIRCDHCHIEAEGAFQVQITATPDFGTSGNDRLYTPGATYDIEVRMMGETKFNANGTLNGFGASFESDDGTAMGVLVAGNGRSDSCPANAPAGRQGVHNESIVYGDCHGVLYEPEADDTFWTFQWIAPSAGAGDITMWYGVVDGDHQGEASLGDDTVQGSLRLLEE